MIGASVGATIRESVDLGEVQRALTLPVFGGHEAGDDRGSVARSTTISQSERERKSARKFDALLPVVQRFVAEEPRPLPVHRVADTGVRVDGTGGVVGVVAGGGVRVRPVTVAGASCISGQNVVNTISHFSETATYSQGNTRS